MFDAVPKNVSFGDLEQKILQFWRKNQTFEKSLELRRDCDTYIFYDGPPFATGLPHYGHLLAGTIKDVVPRYQTMKGKYVDRTFGWDCHGLPVENEMEKELGLSSRHEIEEYGVARFNEACRSIVMRYTEEWKELVERIGRWVDFDNGYKTMDRDFMESTWWVFKQLWDKGLIYEGHKILPYCPRCATPLSNFEANQGYEEVQDPSVTIRFQSLENPNLYYLIWTTTPWTLPSNMALAVAPDIEYIHVHDPEDGCEYVLASDCLEQYYGDRQPEIIARVKGRELLGRRYAPLFPYFADKKDEGGFRLVPGDFVTTESGTGIVHIAPGFGEDDAALGAREELPVVCPVDEECRFTEDVGDYTGESVKDTDRKIIERLKKEGKLVHRSTYQHSYPHCWRCETPLIYRAVSTWFVRVESVKERMLAANRDIHWVPEHIREGRFGKWLENAHDWAVSRNRYWGCPLPIWRDRETGETVCIGSVDELEALTGKKVDDIHKHYVDELEIPSQVQNGKKLQRVPEVLDCWFESGSMPYAEHHYPFENKEFVENNFPADFIAEGLDQTRGWFYTLVVLAVALFDKPPFKNVIVNGLVLAEDGKKMSKRLKNYPSPNKIMSEYGADALRLTLLDSPVVRAEDLRFSEKAVREVMRSVILPLWNAYTFLVTYARVDNWSPEGQAEPPQKPENTLDRWILSRCASTVADVEKAMDNYELQQAADRFRTLVDELTNWYIRRSRRRFWKSSNDEDKQEAYATLHYVLVTFSQIAAPFIPFVAEMIYRNLRSEDMPESIHLCDYPAVTWNYRDGELDSRMDETMTAVSLGRYLRSQAEIKIRQPLKKAILVSMDADVRHHLAEMKDVIGEELNVKEVEVREDEESLVNLSAKPNFKVLGPRLGQKMKEAAGIIKQLSKEDIERLRIGESVDIMLSDGLNVNLSPGDIELSRSPREDLPVANRKNITVAIDTSLDEKLTREGWARELVNRIQNLRKEAGLDVTDRINVAYQLPADIAVAVEDFREYIRRETLAETVASAELPPDDRVDMDGKNDCRLAVSKTV